MNKDIFDILNDGKFDNEELDLNENIDDIEKKKIKKYVLGTSKNNGKKVRRVAVCAVIAVVIGITSIPAVAENIPIIDEIYKSLGLREKYLDYTKYIGKTVKHNGTAVTIDNIVATKDKMIITTKIQGDSNISMDDLSKVSIDIRVNSREGNDKYWSSGEFYDKDYENNIISKIIKIEDKDVIKEKDELKLEIKFPDEYKKEVNYAMDFSKSFNDIIEIKSDKEIKELNMSVDKIEANALGSKVLVNKKLQESDTVGEIRMILKVNNGIYINGSASIPNEGGGEFNFNNVTYKDFKDSNKISIIPIISKLTAEDMNNLYKELEKNNYFEDNTTENNVTYKRQVKFKDGTVGEVYKVERNKESTKLYYKGATDKHALLMALTAQITLGAPGEKPSEKSYSLDFYKDDNMENGYVLEIKGIDENENIQVYCDPNIMYVDKYTIGEEVKIK